MITEHQIQVAIFQWAVALTCEHPELALMFAVPNSAKRSIRAGIWMKAEGLKSGVPDICLPVGRCGKNALFIEMKSEKGRLSDNQKSFLDLLAQHGNEVKICRSFTEAVEVISSYLRGEK